MYKKKKYFISVTLSFTNIQNSYNGRFIYLQSFQLKLRHVVNTNFMLPHRIDICAVALKLHKA